LRKEWLAAQEAFDPFAELEDVMTIWTPASLQPVLAATKFGEFTLASGKKSDFYFGGRRVTMDRQAVQFCAKAIIHYMSLLSDRPTAIGGPATAAIPLASATLCMLATDMRLEPQLTKSFYVRSEPKQHGLKNLLEGPPIGAADKVVLVDDTLTSGGSLLKAAAAVKETGAKIVGVYVILDRDEGGAAAIERELGIKPDCSLTKTILKLATYGAVTCPRCEGKGEVLCTDGGHPTEPWSEGCPKCLGLGKVADHGI
jgi:orotate phosphoribosyltransferase